MRVLLDENIDRRLKESFDNGFVVMTVTERGWSGRSDRELFSSPLAPLRAFAPSREPLLFFPHAKPRRR